jgi:hypothetical protein
LAWTLEGLLLAGTLVWLYGMRGSGKSFLLLSWALAIASGRPWCGRPTTQGTVVIVAAEGAWGMRLRMRGNLKAMGLSDAAVFTVPSPINLGDLASVAEFLETIAPLDPSVIILDPYFRLSPGLDPLSAKDFGVAFVGITAIQQAHPTAVVIVADHGNKSGLGGATGSSMKEAVSDTVLELRRDGVGSALTLTTTKMKDAPEAPAIPLLLEQRDDTCVIVADEPTTGAGNERERNALQALADIEVPGGVSASAWLEASGMAQSSFYRIRAALVRSALVEQVGAKYQRTAGGRSLTPNSHQLPIRSHGSSTTTTPTPTPYKWGVGVVGGSGRREAA